MIAVLILLALCAAIILVSLARLIRLGLEEVGKPKRSFWA